MGMSASQVRYLTLTARIHDVENQAQRIQNQKLLLANDSDAVYQRYLDALDKTKMQVRQFDDASGTSQMVDITLDVLYRGSCDTMVNGYTLTGIDGSLYLPFELAAEDVASFPAFEQRFANYLGITDIQDLEANTQQYNYVWAMWNYINEQAGTDVFGTSDSNAHVQLSDDSRIALVSESVQHRTQRLSVVHSITGNQGEFDTEWLRDIIGYGYANFQMLSDDTLEIPLGSAHIQVWNEELETPDWEDDDEITSIDLHFFNSSTVSTDTQMMEVSDEIELAVAEVEYESDMKKINAKDKKYDTELKKLENQRSAMKEEMDGLKKVIDDNISRTFKLFS